MAELLTGLGASVGGIGTPTLRVRASQLVERGARRGVSWGCFADRLLLIGPLLARRGRARLALPGGDFPARRSLRTHLQALMAMGVASADARVVTRSRRLMA